jgi:hypothetical protein
MDMDMIGDQVQLLLLRLHLLRQLRQRLLLFTDSRCIQLMEVVEKEEEMLLEEEEDEVGLE